MNLFKIFCRYFKKEFPVWTTPRLQICDKRTYKTNQKKPDRKKPFGSIHDQYFEKSLHYGRMMNEILSSSNILNGVSSSNQFTSRGRHFWSELCKKSLPKLAPTEQSILQNQNYRCITKDNKIIEHEKHCTASCDKTEEFSSFKDGENLEYTTKKVNELNCVSESPFHNDESSESESWFKKFCKPPGKLTETKKLQVASIFTATKPTEVCQSIGNKKTWATKNIDTTKMGINTFDLKEDINSKTLILNRSHQSDRHNYNSVSEIFVKTNEITQTQDSGEDAQEKIRDVEKRLKELETRQTENNNNISNAQNVISNLHSNLQENIFRAEDSQHQSQSKNVSRASKYEKSVIDEGVQEIPSTDMNKKGKKQSFLEMNQVKRNKNGSLNEVSTVKENEELKETKVEHGDLNRTMLLNYKRRSMVQPIDVTRENNTYCNLIRLQETDGKTLHSQRQENCHSICEDGEQDSISKPTNSLREHSINKNRNEVTTGKIGFEEIIAKNTKKYSGRGDTNKNKMLLDENKKLYDIFKEANLPTQENLQNVKAHVQTVQPPKAPLPQENKEKYENKEFVEHQEETETICLNKPSGTEKEESKATDISLADPKISIGSPSLDVCNYSNYSSIEEKSNQVPKEDDSLHPYENKTETIIYGSEDETRKLQDDIRDLPHLTPGVVTHNKINLTDLIESPKESSMEIMEQKAEKYHLHKILNSKDSRAILKSLSRLSGCLHKLSANTPKTDRKVSHIRQIASSCTPEQSKENLCQESNCQCIYCVFGVECKIYPTTCKRRDICGELDTKQDLLCKMCHIFNTRGADQLNKYFKNDYKNKEYYLYTDASYYDIHQFLAEVRLSYDLMMKIKEKLGVKKM